MATSPVEDLHCGTYASGYLKNGNAALPSTPGEEVEATVCFYYQSSEPCKWTTTIEIKKCSNFLIYKLPNTPVCDMGYCGQQ